MFRFGTGSARRARSLALLTLTAALLALLALGVAGLLFGVGPIPALEPSVVDAPGAGAPAAGGG